MHTLDSARLLEQRLVPMRVATDERALGADIDTAVIPMSRDKSVINHEAAKPRTGRTVH